MKVIDSPGGGGPRGTGYIEVLDNTHVRVNVTNRDGEVTDKVLEFPQGVENVRVKNWPLQSAKDLSISLTPDGEDFMYTPRPRNGQFFVKFVGFGAEPGELPTIRWETKKDFEGKPWLPARLKTFALYEILNPGEVKGMQLLDTITYEFEWDENLEEFTIVGSKRKKYHEHVLRFLNVFGFDMQNDTFHYGNLVNVEVDGVEEEMPNVLVELEDMLKSEKRIAQVVVEDGWVQEETLQPGPYGVTEESLALLLQA